MHPLLKINASHHAAADVKSATACNCLLKDSFNYWFAARATHNFFGVYVMFLEFWLIIILFWSVGQ